MISTDRSPNLNSIDLKSFQDSEQKDSSRPQLIHSSQQKQKDVNIDLTGNKKAPLHGLTTVRDTHKNSGIKGVTARKNYEKSQNSTKSQLVKKVRVQGTVSNHNNMNGDASTAFCYSPLTMTLVQSDAEQSSHLYKVAKILDSTQRRSANGNCISSQEKDQMNSSESMDIEQSNIPESYRLLSGGTTKQQCNMSSAAQSAPLVERLRAKFNKLMGNSETSIGKNQFQYLRQTSESLQILERGLSVNQSIEFQQTSKLRDDHKENESLNGGVHCYHQSFDNQQKSRSGVNTETNLLRKRKELSSGFMNRNEHKAESVFDRMGTISKPSCEVMHEMMTGGCSIFKENIFCKFEATQATGNTILVQTDLTSLSGTSAPVCSESAEKVTVVNQDMNLDGLQLMHQQFQNQIQQTESQCQSEEDEEEDENQYQQHFSEMRSIQEEEDTTNNCSEDRSVKLYQNMLYFNKNDTSLHQTPSSNPEECVSILYSRDTDMKANTGFVCANQGGRVCENENTTQSRQISPFQRNQIAQEDTFGNSTSNCKPFFLGNMSQSNTKDQQNFIRCSSSKQLDAFPRGGFTSN